MLTSGVYPNSDGQYSYVSNIYSACHKTERLGTTDRGNFNPKLSKNTEH